MDEGKTETGSSARNRGWLITFFPLNIYVDLKDKLGLLSRCSCSWLNPNKFWQRQPKEKKGQTDRVKQFVCLFVIINLLSILPVGLEVMHLTQFPWITALPGTKVY